MPTPQYNLHLKGFVGGADFDRNYVDYVLGKHCGKHVDVLIDSLGGSVATALSIASAFRHHGDVAVHFVGMNASAATIASLGAKHISIDANAMYLVHKCSQDFFEWGTLNADQFATLIADCEKIKADLDKLDCNIAAMYSTKCKKPHSELLALMQRGGWLTAQEAKEWGFVDEVTNLASDNAPKLTDAVASEMAAVGMPIPDVPIATAHNEHEISAFARFLAAFTSLFRNPKPDTTAMNPDTLPTDSEQQTANSEQRSTPSAERIADLEAQVAALTAERDSLQAANAALQTEVAALKAAPGATSNAVVVQPKAQSATDPLAAVFRDTAEARRILAEIN